MKNGFVVTIDAERGILYDSANKAFGGMIMRTFNTEGICVKKKHYIVDISNKLDKIIALIDQEKYFTINKPRQYGKSTTINLLEERLEERYLVLSISFEGIGSERYRSEAGFIEALLLKIHTSYQLIKKARKYIKIYRREFR